MASGGRRTISHVTESAWGTASGTAFKTDRVLAGPGVLMPRTNIMSQELRGDRGVASGRLGNKLPIMNLPGEMSYGTWEDYLASALNNAAVAAGTAISSLTTTVVAGVTNTMAATGIGGTGGSLIAVGDWVKVSGFGTSYTSNNGFWKVTARADNLITLGEAVNSAGASLLTAASAQTNITVTRMGYIISGTTEKSLQIEQAQLDISVWQLLVGAVVNNLNLSIVPDSIIGVNFDLIGKSMATPAAAKYAATYVDATTSTPMMANDAVSALRINGVPTALCTSLNLNLTNGAEAKFPVFQENPYRIATGRSNLSGSMSLYFIASTYWAAYLAETRIALSVQMMNNGATAGYAIDIPRVMLGGINPNVTENDIVHDIPFQVEADATTGLVNWRWNILA